MTFTNSRFVAKNGLDNNGKTIANVATPTTSSDAATKAYVDSAVSGGTGGTSYTDANARAAISATGSLSYNSTTGVISYTAPTLATVATTGAYNDLTGKPTLFTTANARTAISLTAGSSGATYNSSTGVLDLSSLTSGGTSFTAGRGLNLTSGTLKLDFSAGTSASPINMGATYSNQAGTGSMNMIDNFWLGTNTNAIVNFVPLASQVDAYTNGTNISATYGANWDMGVVNGNYVYNKLKEVCGDMTSITGMGANTLSQVASVANNLLNTMATGSAGATNQVLAKNSNSQGDYKWSTPFGTSDARSAISATGSLSYNSTTGVISYTAPTLATVATTGAYSDLTGKPDLSGYATAANPTLTGTVTLGAASVLSGDFNAAANTPIFKSNTGTTTRLRVVTPTTTGSGGFVFYSTNDWLNNTQGGLSFNASTGIPGVFWGSSAAGVVADPPASARMYFSGAAGGLFANVVPATTLALFKANSTTASLTRKDYVDDQIATRAASVHVTRQAPTWAATTTIDCSLGSVVDLTLTGNTLFAFTGAVDGQKITLRVKQDATGSRTATWDTMVRFGADLTSITLSTAASKTDIIGLIYNATDSKYDVVALSKGF